MVTPPKPKKPTYRLLIPTVQLGALSYLDPEIRVSEIHGRGSLSGESRTEVLPYGKLLLNMVGTAQLDYKWGSGPRPRIDEIYKSFIDKGIPDISVDSLSIVRNSNVKGNPCLVELRFGKDTVHPEVYEKLVVDGAYPKQETAKFIGALKKSLSSTVSQEVLKRIRYSCLILHRILPYPDLIYDANAVYSLCSEKYMRLIKEIYKHWELFDYEYIPKAKP
jgi:hypothetical protein